jgi:hypothetical protein
MLEIDVGGGKKVVLTSKPASAKPPATSAARVSAPQVISEHGQGGGSRSSDTGKKPTQQQTKTGYATPASTQPKSTASQVISEHGQGGGSGSHDTGRKPTRKETRVGYATTATIQPRGTAAGIVSEHGEDGGSGSSDTGRKPTTREARVGYGTTRLTQAPEPSSRSLQASARALSASPTTASLRIPIIGGLVNVVRHVLGKGISVWPKVASDVSTYGKHVLHEAPAVLHKTTNLVDATGRLLGNYARQAAKVDRSLTRLEDKFGRDVVDLVKENPGTVASILGPLAIVAPPPADLAFGVLAATASAYAGADAFKDRHYVEAATDVAAALVGGGSSVILKPALVEAASSEAATAARATQVARAVSESSADDLPDLSVEQRSSLDRALRELSSARQSVRIVRSRMDRADLVAELLNIYGDPNTNPSIRKQP